MDKFLKEHIFADIFDRDILSYIDREIVTVSSLASVHDPFVRSHMREAANAEVQESFLTLCEQLTGGHIPGRYMAKKIKSANLLNEYISETGNPFKFIYLYDKAVKDQIAAPKFSETSISNLKVLEKKLREMQAR